MAVFNDANLNKAYQDIYGQLQGSGGYTPLSMPEQTLDSITEQLAGTLRPQYEQAISKLYGLTKEQKARIDVDAASRGMTSSSMVTDLKNRAMNSLSEQVRGIETDYAAQLANDALNQYQKYIGDKLALDQYNQKLQMQLGDDAYGRVMQQLSAGLISPKGKGGRGGGGGNDLPIEIPPVGANDEYLKALKAENDELRGYLGADGLGRNRELQLREPEPVAIPTGVMPKTTAGGGNKSKPSFVNLTSESQMNWRK